MSAALRVWESKMLAYRRLARSHALLSFVQPMLYLLGMGVGVGSLVDRGTGGSTTLGDVQYIAFLAPALLATTAMFACANEALWPVMDGFMWSSTFRSMAATPLTPTDIVNGVALWQATRAALAAGGVAVALMCFPDTRSWGLLPAIPCAVLMASALAMPLSAWSSTREMDQSFPAIMRFAIMPMFLFGGAFYPVDALPGWMHPIARITPLWHGIELCRGFALRTLEPGPALAHVAVLAAYVLAGWLACRVTFARRLAA